MSRVSPRSFRWIPFSRGALLALMLAEGCVPLGSPRTDAPVRAGLTPIPLAGGEKGIGFDDVRFASALGRVLVPAGHTGRLDLIDPDDFGVTSIDGFHTEPTFPGGHDVGSTSADAGSDILVAIDRSSKRLHVGYPKTWKIVASAALGGKPDLVRYVALTREAWVTEPDGEQIEVLSLPADDAAPVHAAFIPIHGGPESLTIDPARDRAYTYLVKGMTVAIDLRSRSIVAQWPNGCAGSSGAALDASGARLFIGCDEGKVVVQDLGSGKVLGSLAVATSIDHVAYSPSLHHLYVPDTKAATMATLAVSASGALSQLGSVATVPGTECVTTDDRGHAYLCDPLHGKILVFTDPYPASR